MIVCQVPAIDQNDPPKDRLIRGLLFSRAPKSRGLLTSLAQTWQFLKRLLSHLWPVSLVVCWTSRGLVGPCTWGTRLPTVQRASLAKQLTVSVVQVNLMSELGAIYIFRNYILLKLLLINIWISGSSIYKELLIFSVNNPCSEGTPYVSDGEAVSCDPDACPSGYTCTKNLRSAVCCPGNF